MLEQNEICRKELHINISNVEQGKPLTRPLKQLNQYCEFRKVWDKWAGKDEEVKAKKKAYSQKPEVKAKKKAYNRIAMRKKLHIPKSRWRVI